MGRLIRSSEFDGANNLIQRIEQLYDKANRLEKQSWVIGGKAYSESYTYDTTDGTLSSAQTATGDKILYYYDGLKRLNETGVKDSAGNTIYRTGYIYKAGTETNQTTSMIRGFTVWNPDYTNIVSTRYEYDALGNITRIEDGTGTARTLAEYTYDSLNQLTQEKIYNYNSNGTYTSTDTYVYTYDSAGNILTEKKNGAVVNAYTYSTGPWADQLVAVNGEEITYDGSGNPEMYYSANGIDYDFCWTEGRQLAWLQGWGEVPFRVNYEYDADGIRVAKSTETITGIYSDHAYVTQNGKVMRETIGTGTTAKVLDFVYDNSGKPFALIYTNGTATPVTCYYVLNIQGDVIALMTADRTIVARYTYNAWGKLLSVTDKNGNAITSASHIANLNPIRYRGYYYDTETGFYYLRSRYYDPANHRFVNADSQFDWNAGFVGVNLFAYCANNPVIFSDYSGESIILACAIVGAIIGIGSGIIVGDKIAESKGLTKDSGWDYWQYIIGGGIVGGGIGFIVGWYAGSYVLGASSMLASWSNYIPTVSTGNLAYDRGANFEQWFYSFFNIPEHSQQVRFFNSRFDAIMHGVIVDLKNYDFTKYSSYSRLIKDFVSQGKKYCECIGAVIDGQIIKGVTFFFSSEPPQAIIEALNRIGIGVEWVR